MEDVVKKVDIDKLSEEEFKALEKRMGQKVVAITDEAIAKANKLLQTYGLRAKMQIIIEKEAN